MEGSVRKRGEKWYYSFELATVGGKRKRLERVGGRTKKEAEAALRKALEEYENRGEALKLSKKSFADYLDYWMEDYAMANLRYNTRASYKCLIHAHIKPHLGSYPISALTPGRLDTGYKAMAKKGMSAQQLSKIASLVSTTLDMAVYPYALIKDNPAHYLKHLPRANERIGRRDEVITPEIFAKLLEACPYGHLMHMFLQIAYGTGCRLAEIRALTWDDVDFDNATLAINKQWTRSDTGFELGPTKTEASTRELYLDTTLLSLLKTYRKDQLAAKLRYGGHYTIYYTIDGTHVVRTTAADALPAGAEVLNFICTREDGSAPGHDVIAHYYKRLSAAGGENFHFKFHNLRHAHATYLINKGASVKGVQQRLGHDSYVTTVKKYVDDTTEMAKDTIKVFEQARREG